MQTETQEKVYMSEKQMISDITGYAIGTINACLHGDRQDSDAARVIRKVLDEMRTYQKITMHTLVEILKGKYGRKDS
ncbi:hypothetical protein QNI19_14715 [Cytophagaceae bacterium DM2B3-1]|uniref:Uncharacterized protein n=1 Tax=Xanthocytophaga flava TaxID=3048013 RepID=A0ABT7CKB1_9BACT|nr:hypothetical protein [Xanthocytophaga flavus]MDJ1494193.1 hypothetical protein [Xanthocytophaga flavus]